MKKPAVKAVISPRKTRAAAKCHTAPPQGPPSARNVTEHAVHKPAEVRPRKTKAATKPGIKASTEQAGKVHFAPVAPEAPKPVNTKAHLHVLTRHKAASQDNGVDSTHSAQRASTQLMNKPAARTVFSPHKTRAATKAHTKDGSKAVSKQALLAGKAPTAQQPVKTKAQLKIVTKPASASLAKGMLHAWHVCSVSQLLHADVISFGNM